MKLREFKRSLFCSKQYAELPIEQLHSNKDTIPSVVVSLTATPSSFDVAHLAIRSVLSGSKTPEKVILWLHESYKAQLPDSLESLIGLKFEICFSSMECPHLTLVESLAAFPEKNIVTCASDALYEYTWLENLYEDHKRYPCDVIAHECRSIAYDEYNNPQSYSYWYQEVMPGASYDGLMPVGSSGAWYPADCFHTDVLNQDLFLKLTPNNDDLWFKAMSYLVGTKARLTSSPVKKTTQILNSQAVNNNDLNLSLDDIPSYWGLLAEHYDIKPFLPFAVNGDSKIIPSNEKVAPIDAVITWVDGDDPIHAKKMNEYLATKGVIRPNSAAATRFSDCGEVSYCVASLLKFAPWLRRIIIVTDNQRPKVMDWIANTPYADKVELVGHQDMFKGYEQHLPTFSNRSITAAMWNIPELADQFIYLNDDFVLIKPVKPTDFFRDGKMVIRGRWNWVALLEDLKYFVKAKLQTIKPRTNKIKRPRYKLAQVMSAKLAGYRGRYFQLEHNPHPMRQSTTRAFVDKNPELYNQQLSHKFRSSEQYNPESLAAHLELKHNNVIIDNRLSTFHLTPEKLDIKKIELKLEKAQANENAVFACIQSIDKATLKSRELIFSWLKNQIGTL